MQAVWVWVLGLGLGFGFGFWVLGFGKTLRRWFVKEHRGLVLDWVAWGRLETGRGGGQGPGPNGWGGEASGNASRRKDDVWLVAL